MPRPLGVLLALVAVCGAAWALASPAFLTPDEDVHFSYVETLGELHRLPGGEGGFVARDESFAIGASNVPPTSFFPYANPEWSQTGYDRWRRTARTLESDDGGGANPASTYPPLYYLIAAVPYALAKGGDVFTRLFAVRLASVGFLLLTTVAAWLLLGQLFDRRRGPQIVGAATVGLWPTLGFMSTAVNPDALLIPLFTLALWRGTVIAREGLTPTRGALLGGLVGAAVIVKATALALIPPVGLFVLWAAWRERRRIGRAIGGMVGAGVAAAVPMGAWLAVTLTADRSAYSQASQIGGGGGGVDYREFASYLWQFYLPRLPFMQPVDHHFAIASDSPVLNTWVGMGWGVYGWANVWFPPRVYWVAFALTAALLGLAGWRAIRWWRGGDRAVTRGGWAALALLAGVTLALVGGLHWTDYRFYAFGYGPFAQGRYLLPCIAVAGCVVAYALDGAPRRVRGWLTGSWLGFLIVLQLASLGLVVSRFYA